MAGTWDAKLEETERGLFRAIYPAEMNRDDDARAELPDGHIAAHRESVKMRVETMAKGMGYERVEWAAQPAGAASVMREPQRYVWPAGGFLAGPDRRDPHRQAPGEDRA